MNPKVDMSMKKQCQPKRLDKKPLSVCPRSVPQPTIIAEITEAVERILFGNTSPNRER